MKALIFCFLLALSAPYPQQSKRAPTTSKTYIYLTGVGDDRVGTSFVYAFKEEIAASSRYTLDWSEEISKRPVLFIYVTSVDSGTSEAGRASAISIVAERYANADVACAELTTHLVLVVGAARTKEMARDVIATIDRDFSRMLPK